jgi:hypothetical protein
MRRNTLAVLALGFGLLIGSRPVVGHHSFSAEFDSAKQVEKRGFVTKVDWTNPHVWFYINVKDEKTGKIVNWGFEMGPPHGLQARGWTRDLMKIGDEVIVTGSAAKNGSTRGNARSVILAKTGKTYGTASSEETQQQ